MFSPSRLRTFAIVSALASTLLASSTAAAQPNDGAHCRVQLGAGLPFVPCPHDYEPRHASALSPSAESSRLKAARAQERYYAFGDTEPPTNLELNWAKARERYYSSYGEPEPIIAPVAPASPDDTPWLAIALAAAVTLAAASIAGIHRRRLRLRRRLARAAT